MRSALMIASAILLAGAAGPALQPGMWEVTVRIQSMTGPNLPPGLAQQLAGRPTIVRNCISATDIQKAPEKVFAASKGDCSYRNFAMTGGTMRTTLVCKGGLTGQMQGSYTPTSFTATNRTSMPGGMNSVAAVSGRRVGGC